MLSFCSGMSKDVTPKPNPQAMMKSMHGIQQWSAVYHRKIDIIGENAWSMSFHCITMHVCQAMTIWLIQT